VAAIEANQRARSTQAEPLVTDRQHEFRANAGLRFAVPLDGWSE
jgi:hypothetical protein